jgi:predicted Holliday junction resolvase-like endonuclease
MSRTVSRKNNRKTSRKMNMKTRRKTNRKISRKSATLKGQSSEILIPFFDIYG